MVVYNTISDEGSIGIWTVMIIIITLIAIALAILIAGGVEGFGEDATSTLMEHLADIV